MLMIEMQILRLMIQFGWCKAASSQLRLPKVQLMGDKHILNKRVIIETPVWLLAGLSKFWDTNWASWTWVCSAPIMLLIAEHWIWLLDGSPNWLWDIGFGCGEAPSTIRTPPWLSEVHFGYRKASFTFEYSMSLFRFQCDWWQSHVIDTKPMWLWQIKSNHRSSNVTIERQIMIVDRQTWPLQHPMTSWTYNFRVERQLSQLKIQFDGWKGSLALARPRCLLKV